MIFNPRDVSTELAIWRFLVADKSSLSPRPDVLTMAAADAAKKLAPAHGRETAPRTVCQWRVRVASGYFQHFRINENTSEFGATCAT
jgi:hypothetical protein